MSDSIILQNDRLKVEIAQPGTFYKGTRFDWTGFITQVTLDEKHTFCVDESLVPGQGSGGAGLCNEFGSDTPIGYEGTKSGDLFPKLGIGLMKNNGDKEYGFHIRYEIAQNFPIHVDTTAQSATFVVEPIDCRGYALRLTKTLTIIGNQLQIAYKLENTGSKPVKTMEYCHNFVRIDGQNFGPDYVVRMAHPVELEDMVPHMTGLLPVWMRKFPRFIRDPFVAGMVKRVLSSLNFQGNDVHMNFSPDRAFYCRLTNLAKSDHPQWEMTYLPNGAKISETDDFAPCRIALWGVAHVFSPEIFIQIDVKPGETQTWSRRYAFDA